MPGKQKPQQNDIPTLNLAAPAAEEVKAPEAAPAAEEVEAPATEPQPSPVERAYAALVELGYSEGTARDIAMGKFTEGVPSAPAAPEICPQGCFRQGWAGVGDGIDNVSCEHGSWSRARA